MAESVSQAPQGRSIAARVFAGIAIALSVLAVCVFIATSRAFGSPPVFEIFILPIPIAFFFLVAWLCRRIRTAEFYAGMALLGGLLLLVTWGFVVLGVAFAASM